MAEAINEPFQFASILTPATRVAASHAAVDERYHLVT
jgi:hypothetical protein